MFKNIFHISTYQCLLHVHVLQNSLSQINILFSIDDPFFRPCCIGAAMVIQTIVHTVSVWSYNPRRCGAALGDRADHLGGLDRPSDFLLFSVHLTVAMGSVLKVSRMAGAVPSGWRPDAESPDCPEDED